MIRIALIILIGWALVPPNPPPPPLPLAGWGAANSVSPPPIRPAVPLGDFETLTLPLKRAGNLFMVEAEIDSLRGNFILDLGAPYLVLNSTYFRDYEIDSSYFSGTFNSEADFVRRTQSSLLKLRELEFHNLQADVTDLGSIENQRGVQILGLLGVDLFAGLIFELDVRGQQLILHRQLATALPAEPPQFELPLRNQDHVLWVKGTVGGKRIRFSLDTGAELNILDRDLPSEVFQSMEIQRRVEVRGADGTAAEVLVTTVDSYVLGGVKFGKMRTLVANLGTMSRAYGVHIQGVLGYPFFARGRIVLDFQQQHLYMYPYHLQRP